MFICLPFLLVQATTFFQTAQIICGQWFKVGCWGPQRLTLCLFQPAGTPLWLSLIFFFSSVCCLLHLFCCTPKKFMILKHKFTHHFFFSIFFFAMLCKKSGAVLVCVFVCVRLALQVCIVFLCSLLDGVRSESPFSLCHRAFGVCTSFLQIVRSDPAVCSDFPAL